MSNCWGLVVLLLAYSARAASVTLAWDVSTSSDVTEYVIKYGTSQGNYTSSESAGMNTSKTISGLPDGFRYYFIVIARSSTGDSDNSNEVTYRPGITNPPIQILLQSEAALLKPPMISIEDMGAIGGRYIVSTNDDVGLAIFNAVIPFVDEFIIWGRVLSPTEGNDSFYVSHNNQPEDVYDTVYVRTNIWQWTMVNGRGGNDKGIEFAHAIEPRTFIMYSTNQIDFRGRERGTLLDAILITNDRKLIPKTPSSPENLQLTVER